MNQMNNEWWRGAVIYQIYPRSFLDSNGDGVGDLQGVTDKLDYIADLGVDAIWLSPFYTSPMADFGYDVQDYYDVDPCFGNLDDFDRLISKAHSLGLKVITDQVWCHTSTAHHWFLASRSSRHGSKNDWYVWADPRPDGTPPNNWLSVFGGSAWTWEPRRRQYYLHHFLSSQPKLNLRNPQVVECLKDVGSFWLDRGVDGFRLDAIDFMMHDPSLADNPIQRCDVAPLKVFGMQRHKYDMMHPDINGFLKEIRSLTDRYPGTTTVGELSSQIGAFERVHSYTSGGDALHMAYTLKLMKGEFKASAIKQTLEHVESLGSSGWHCWSFNNHDVERAGSRWYSGSDEQERDAFSRMLMALLLSMRGSVCLYQGEELGLTEADLAFSDLKDPFGITYYPDFKGRDGSRTPIPWCHESENAGFSNAKPWLPVPSDHYEKAASKSATDSGSLLNHYRLFLHFRKDNPSLINGDLQTKDLPSPLVGFTRGSGKILVVVNTTNEIMTFDSDGYDSLAGSGFSHWSDGGSVTLPPFGVYFGTK
jgi:alpha-glucosidase